MNATHAPDLTGCDLPDGTVIMVGEEFAEMVYAWRSPEGLHVVRSRIPTANLTPEGHPDFVEATRTFRLAIALEVLAGFVREVT